MKNQFKPLAPPIITKPADLGHQYPRPYLQCHDDCPGPSLCDPGNDLVPRGTQMPRTALKRSIILISSGK